MRIERTQNTVRNILFGSVNRLINIILPFITRTAILYVMGTKYLGLSSLFSSVLSFLSLAELGVGGAMVYSMYGPIARNDDKTICGLLNLYRRFYRGIGLVILCLGLLLMPLLKILVPEELPGDVNLYALYLIYLVNSVLSYWLFAYKNALLQAHQRNDVNSILGSVITPVSYAVMLVCLFATKNYYAYVIWLPIFTIITNLIRSAYVDRYYPNLKPRGEVSTELRNSITKKVKALIGTKLNTVVLHAADNIVMSAFLGLTVIAMYGNYYYIMNSVMGFLGICYTSMTAGIGNSLTLESEEKNYEDFRKFSFMNAWLTGWCTVCLVCLYQPFMKIWTGEELMFPFAIVLQFALYFYVYQIRKIPVTYKDAAGIWWEDRFRPYVCMVINLVMNILLVQVIGVSGIILSTVLSLVVSIPWENYTVFKYVFHRSSRVYYKDMAGYAAAMVVAGAAAFALCSLCGEGFIWFFVRAAICAIVPNVIYIAVNRKRKEFADAMQMAKRILIRHG